jgi:thioredoxin reductase (NADPH)
MGGLYDRIIDGVKDKKEKKTEDHDRQEAGVDEETVIQHPDDGTKDKLDDPETEEFEFDVGAVFYAIGHTPNTDYLEGTGVETDDEGYLKTQGGEGGNQTATGVDGLFGAGDVVDFHYQQAVTAGGMGRKAALDADDYLGELDAAKAAASQATAEGDD